MPADLDVHRVLGDYVAHKTKPVRDRLAKRPRWHVHFAPTGAPRLDQVERFFALLTEKQLRRGGGIRPHPAGLRASKAGPLSSFVRERSPA